MVSKLVVDRERSAVSVAAVGNAHAMEIGDLLNARAKPYLKKGESADFNVVLQLLSRMVAGSKQQMVDADAAHQAELDDDDAVREERDLAVLRLSDHLVNLREIIVGVYGSAAASKVFTGATPADPIALSRFAAEVQKKLLQVKLPPPRIKGSKLDPKEMADELKAMRDDVDNAFEAVQREVREAQGTLKKKNEAIEAHDRVFSGVATTLTGLLTLAGNGELASKVRPSSRRAGVTEEGDSADTHGSPPLPASPDNGVASPA